MRLWPLVVAACGVFAVSAAIVELLRRHREPAPDPEIDALIRAKGVSEEGLRRRFEGYDPALRERTEQKRRGAERARSLAAKVESAPTRKPSLSHEVVAMDGRRR